MLLIYCVAGPLYIENLDYLSASEINILQKRKQIWPNWHLPGIFYNHHLTDDLFYPFFFEGIWEVESIDLNYPEAAPLIYFARFYNDGNGHIIADRSFNTKSIGAKILGDLLLSVEKDPLSANRQLSFFRGGDFLETKVIGRIQENNIDLFITDELSLQIMHQVDETRISRVEILSQFKLCKETELKKDFQEINLICGEQLQATYSEPGSLINTLPLRTNHYKLSLKPINKTNKEILENSITPF